jgi:flagellar protein FliO/FliZ
MHALFFSLSVLMLAVPAWALSDAVGADVGDAVTNKFADPASAAPLVSSGITSVTQVTVALVIVLAILFVIAWAMRRVKLSGLFGHRSQTTLELVQAINLGPKERAVLIKVQDRRLLLGVAPGCVNLLLELSPDSSVVEATNNNLSSGNPPVDVNAPSFKALLKRSMGMS